MKITKSAYTEMIAVALVRHPNEMCGLLSKIKGSDIITCWTEIPNISRTPTDTYIVDPTVQMATWTGLERDGYEIVAAVHSHTHGTPWPSVSDRDDHDPTLLMAIVDVTTLPDITIKAWRATDPAIASMANYRREEITVR